MSFLALKLDQIVKKAHGDWDRSLTAPGTGPADCVITAFQYMIRIVYGMSKFEFQSF